MSNLTRAKEFVLKEMYLPLFLFLLVFTIDKITLKFAGIALLYLLHPDFNFRSDVRKVPLFYPLLLLLEVLKFLLLNRDFSAGHTISFLLGALFWIISFLSLHQMRSIVDQVKAERIDRTLTVFFLINAAISLLQLLMAMYSSGTINPYNFKTTNFGNSTGDLIKGIFLGPSYLNMMISSFFLFFFLVRQNYRLALAAFLVILLTTSNLCNMILLPVLVAFLIFSRRKKARVWAAGFLALFAAFYLLVTPSNLKYIRSSILVPKKQQEEMIAYEKKALLLQRKRRSTIGMADSGSDVPAYSAANVDALIGYPMDSIPDSAIMLTGKPGKLQSFKQTLSYITSGPRPLLFGAGMGGFSSFLALRMSDADREEGSRLFKYLPTYMAPPFMQNHYRIYKALYSLPREFHSVKHFPNSFLDQLFGEYGLVGVALFLLTYAWFFISRFRQLSYGRYLLFLLGGYLVIDYLFEYLSVVSVFELLIFCDLRRAKEAVPATGSLQTRDS
ncbi:MAG TPA: hypothetical protein VG101_18155 [Puia sp.]|jgi:hypothetical protein|nr:hypothetical protein [Puia sp.]